MSFTIADLEDAAGQVLNDLLRPERNAFLFPIPECLQGEAEGTRRFRASLVQFNDLFQVHGAILSHAKYFCQAQNNS